MGDNGNNNDGYDNDDVWDNDCNDNDGDGGGVNDEAFDEVILWISWQV